MKTKHYYFFFLLLFSVIEKPSFADNTWWAQTPSGHYILVSLNYHTNKCTVVAPAYYTDATDSWGNHTKPTGNLVIPNRIPYRYETEHGDTVIYYDIVEIGDYAFYGCDSLTSVTLPNNVKVIWNRAFMDCHQLTSITFGDSLYLISHYAFYRCTNLASINIPNTVYICGEHSFDSCINMTTAVVRSQIVDYDAFAHCYNLASLTLGDSVHIIEVGSFSENNLTEVTIPPSMQDMGYIISSSITTVNYNADSCYHGGFGGCSNLATLNIGNNVKMIPIGAFSSCPALTSVTIPKSVKIIEGGAFADDYNLTTVYFNADSCIQMTSSQYEVGPVFNNCHNLTTVYVGNNVKTIPDHAFGGRQNISHVFLGDSVSSIGNSSFSGCHSLQRIQFPSSVRRIGNSSFHQCRSFDTLYMGTNVSYIGSYSFSSSTNLTTVFCGDTVLDIGDHAFAYCPNLVLFKINTVTPPNIGNNCFDNVHSDFVIIVPRDSYNSYCISWNDYENHIHPDKCLLSVSTNGLGQVEGSGLYNYGDTIIVRALDTGLCHFHHWSDGNTCDSMLIVLISDTTITAFFEFDCDSIVNQLPISADFTQCWATEGGAAIAGTSRASLNGSGQTLTSPWMSTSAGTVYYTFTDRRDTTGALWYNGDSVVYYDVSVETAEGVVSTTHWNSENHSMNYISHFPNPGMPFHLVFTYTDTRAVNLHYIENLEVYAYDLTLVVEGPTDVNMGDTTTYTAHVTMPDDGLTTYWDWTLYDQIYQSVPDSIATVIASTDSTRTIVWHSLGHFHLCTSVQKYIPQSVWQFHHHYITVNDTTSITPIAVDCDSISLPYEADFTQCWAAEGGASIIDSNHASITSAGQKITSPWMQSVAGNTYLAWTQQREGDCNYETEQFVITIEDENGVVQSWTESAGNWGSSVNNFTSPGGPIRVSFEYIGSNIVPSFRISDVAIYSYFIEMEIESPAIAQIGDTVTLVAHASLQNGDSLDGKYWYMFDAARHYYSLPPYDDDTTVTIVSQTDNTLSLVWNSVGRYSVTINGYKNVFRGHNAYANASQDINIVNHSFYEEDSIYYTSETKDTVIGCHPQLHSANLPESVRVIKDSAFFNLDNLSSVSLPDGLEQIGKMAFAWNQGITEISLPRGLQYVGDNAFWWDTNLVVINFNADSCRVMSPSTASDGNYWPVFIGCDNVTTINIGENVTRIPDRAFSYCSKLRGTLVIPDAVTYIGTSAFYHWYENWEADNDTFQVVLGSGLTEIGDYAFGCPRSQLSSVISRAAVPPTIYEQTFYRYGPEYTPVLWVPCGSTQAYRTAQHWNRIEDILEDCDGIENPSEENNMKVYSISGNIVVTNAPDEIVTIYDMMGRVVFSSSITNENVHLPMPSAGVYMVKIGSLPAQKVVVMR